MSRAPATVARARLMTARLVACSALIGLLGLLTPAAASALTFEVNTVSDHAPGSDGCAPPPQDCTIREAVQAANDRFGGDTITIPQGTYQLTEVEKPDAELKLAVNMAIIGAGARRTIIRGAPNRRVFEVLQGGSISGLTIAGGRDRNGGGLNNHLNRLTLTDVRVDANAAVVGVGTTEAEGGGIWNDGILEIVRSSITRNTVNTTATPGGGFGRGAGIFNAGRLTATNTTISGNVAGTNGATPPSIGQGGGIYTGAGVFGSISATSNLVHVTLNRNEARGTGASGGNIFTDETRPAGFTLLRTTIVAGGMAPTRQNCNVPAGSEGRNLESRNDCALNGQSDQRNLNPMLSGLAFNGAQTETNALRAGSPAIDRIGTGCPPPETDQRGFPRPANGNGTGGSNCDLGAFENRPPVLRVQVLPPTAQAGIETDFEVTVTAVGVTGRNPTVIGPFPVANAQVRLARQLGSTDRDGKVMFTETFRFARTLRVRASKPGLFSPGFALLTINP